MRLADRFVLEREVGSGGMARVYLGRDEVLDRPVAVKVLKPMHGDTDIGVRFRREGRTAARLSHPNIVQVYDAGEGDLEGNEVSYIVMEYLSGGDLKELIDRCGTLPEAELARFGEEVCAGLAHAHGRGIVHRDIKPHNILLDEKGRAKVSDFGIARALDTTQATRTGAYLGTALYSSPEQLQGHKVTPKSDVYSLGATLYQAATGGPPFTGTPIEVASQHVSKQPPPLYGADVGEELQALILSCLAKNAEDRPSTEQAQSRFASIAPTAAPVPPAAPAAAPRKPRRERPRSAPTVVSSGGRTRRRGLIGGVLAALAILAVLGVVGVLALPNLPGGDTNASQDNSSNEQVNVGGANADNGSNENRRSQGDGSVAENAPEPTDQNTGNSEERPAPPENEPERAGQQGQDEPPEQAAVQAVEEFYTAAAAEDYDRSSALLTTGWRQEYFPTQTIFESTFASLQNVRFEGEPTAEVSGDTATVTGQTVATHDDRIERNQGTWTLINSGDRWIISEWSVEPISSQPT
ncbi:MAG: protein kinase [Rubrobacter sp.]